MALTIEDGTIVAGADSYVSEVEADTYWTNRGSPTQWTGLTSAQKESALRQATEYLEVNYCYKGSLEDTTQPLSFPRTAFYDREGRLLAGEGVIPTAIKNAQIELAIRISIDNTRLDTTPSDNNIIRERVGDHEIQFDAGKTSGSTTIYGYVEKILRPYLALSTLSSSSIVRG